MWHKSEHQPLLPFNSEEHGQSFFFGDYKSRVFQATKLYLYTVNFMESPHSIVAEKNCAKNVNCSRIECPNPNDQLCFIVDCSCWRSIDKIPNVRYNRYGSRSSLVEAIDFQTSSNIILRGYRLWNDRRLFPYHNITIQLYKGNTSIASKSLTYDTRFSSKKSFEVYFSRHIYLQAGVNYTAAVRMPKGNYIAQNSGMKYNFCSGVDVAFMKSGLKVPKYSSYVNQIPALIFLSLKC